MNTQADKVVVFAETVVF